MIGLPFDFLSGWEAARGTRPLRLPPALESACYGLTQGRGVHIFSGDVPKSSWQDVEYSQAMIGLFSGRAAGEARWLDRDVGPRVHPLRSGDVWFVAPGVRHSCELHRKSDVVVIFLERWHLEELFAHRYSRLVGTGSVAQLSGYFPIVPILRDLHRVVDLQCKGLPVCRDGSSTVDEINAALVFAQHLWFFHYCGLRTEVDGEAPENLLRELREKE